MDYTPKTRRATILVRNRVSIMQWVVWRYEQRDGNWTKPPYNARTGEPASTTDPQTWSDYDRALAVYQAGGWDGIGFVLTDQDPFAGIDLDHCVDPGTRGIDSWALSIVKRVNSYTELSPSGTGLHIIVAASLPSGRRRKGNIEMYDSGMYLTMTGQHVEGTPTGIEERQLEIAALHAEVFSQPTGEPPSPESFPNLDGPDPPLSDGEVFRLASRARNGQKFLALWGGNTSLYGGDDSAADQALCAILAPYCSSAAQLDRLFRRSRLYREKWERADYRTDTITKAFSLRSWVYTRPEFTVGRRAKK